MSKEPKIIYEHSTPQQVEGVIVDGMSELIGDDVTSSDYDATVEPWPGVPNIPLPEAFIHKD